MKKILIFLSILLLPTVTRAMEPEIWDKISEDLEELGIPCLSLGCGELDSLIFPRFLNAEEIQNLILGKGMFKSDSGHRLLLASTNPETGCLYRLTSTAYLEAFGHKLCAYRVCHKSTYESPSAGVASEEGVTNQNYR